MVNYELKKKNEPAVKSNEDGSMTITQGFITGVVGCPLSYGMVAGDAIVITVEGAYAKTGLQIEEEVNAAVNAYIAQKYPPTE